MEFYTISKGNQFKDDSVVRRVKSSIETIYIKFMADFILMSYVLPRAFVV